MANAVTPPRLFARSGLKGTNTVLNWHKAPEEEFRFYGEAFWNAAKKLAEDDRLDSGGLADFAACPVVYLYRHALELFLKDILIGKGGESLHPRPDPKVVLQYKHALTKLLPDVRRIFEELGWDSTFGKEFVLTFDDFERVVNELQNFDPGSFGCRYPVDMNLGASLNSEPFSVREFARIMDEVLETLCGACNGLANM